MNIIINDETCKKWMMNKTINPLSNRKIKENGPTYKMLEKKCSKSELKSELKSYVKKERVSSNIDDRIDYYNIVKDYINRLKLKHTNNCIHTYKINESYEPTYSVGKNIILEEKLGQGSYGIVFRSYFRPTNKAKREFGKTFKLVVKICEITEKNKLEIDIFNKLTYFTTKKICPHFPISYGYLICNKLNKISYSSISSAISSNNLFYKNSISDYRINDDSTISSNIMDKENLYLIVNEYADTPFSVVLKNHDINVKINTIIQTLISIMFFQKYMNMSHNDTHGYNFLCHFIKPGGYYHYRIYNVDYYLENLGFLIVINDFGLAKELNYKRFYYDFSKYTQWFIKYRSYDIDRNILLFINELDKVFTKKFESTRSSDIINASTQFVFYSYLFKYINDNFPKYLLTIKPDGNIINKTPYIIE